MTIKSECIYHENNKLFARRNSYKNVYYNQDFNISVIEQGNKTNYFIGLYGRDTLMLLKDFNNYPIKDITKGLLSLLALRNAL